MRYALYRLTSPILDRIPDISHQPKSRQVSIGLAASLLFHLLLLVLALLVTWVLPKHGLLSFAKTQPQLQEIEITVIPPAIEEETRLVPLEELRAPQFLDTTGLAGAATAPEKALFESDRNMTAASELPALGNLPLPSQLGRVAPDAPVFENQQLSLGKAATPFAPRPSASPPAETAAPPPDVKVAPPSPPLEAPPAEEKAPPTTMKEVATPADDEIATMKRPASPPEAAPRPRMRTTVPVLLQNTPPAPEPSAEPGSQLQMEKTRIEGSITNRGRNAVDAAETPLGRYQSGVKMTIGSRWQYYVTDSARGAPFAPGSVRVSFVIGKDGKVRNVHTNGNTSTPAYAFASERAVLDSKFPPLPPGLIDVLPKDGLEITYTFTIYSP